METGEPQGEAHAICRQLIAALRADYEERIALLEARLASQQEQILKLSARLNQTSRNSSKPPSSDPPGVPPRSGKTPTGRSPGGQPGHEGRTRPLLPPDQVQQIVDLKPTECEGCGTAIEGEDPEPFRHQVTEVPPMHASVTEYRWHRLCCPKCRRVSQAGWPAEVPRGMFGPRLQALIGYLSGKSHQSKRLMQDLLEDCVGISISLGAIKAAEEAVSEALAEPVRQARAYVHQQPVAHADETSWRQKREKAWLWVAVTTWVTVFLIHAKRGKVAAQELLGPFKGHLHTDRWGGYNAHPLAMRQMCWAHLMRDFEGFYEYGSRAARLSCALDLQGVEVFHLWHRLRDGPMSRATFQKRIQPIQQEIRRLLHRGTRCGAAPVEGKCRKILAVWPALWTFVDVEGVEPTNNAAERAIRPAVLYRKGSLGTQSQKGSRFVERILTAVTTLRQQGRNVLDYLQQALLSRQLSQQAPTLLPARLQSSP